MNSVELQTGTRIAFKWHDGRVYCGRIRRIHSDRYLVDCDDVGSRLVDLKDIFVASSLLMSTMRKLSNSESKLLKLTLARDEERRSLHQKCEEMKKTRRRIAKKELQIDREFERLRRALSESQTSEYGKVLTRLREDLVQRERENKMLEQRCVDLARSSTHTAVVYAD